MNAELVRELFDYDAESGELRWRIRPSRSSSVEAGDVAGAPLKIGYIQVGYGGRLYRAHRLVWLHVYGVWPQQHIDHKDGDRSNNRLANLRDVSNTVNLQNRSRARTDNSTGLLGVSKNGRAFQAIIVLDGKKLQLGTFPTPQEAHAAYMAAKRELHPGFVIR